MTLNQTEVFAIKAALDAGLIDITIFNAMLETPDGKKQTKATISKMENAIAILEAKKAEKQ